MGGILGAIFGGGQQTSGSTRPDQVSQDLNRTRLMEYQNLLDRGGSIGNFAGPGPDRAYNMTNASKDLLNTANRDYLSGTVDTPNFDMGYNRNFRTGDINSNFNTDFKTGDISNNFNTDYGAGNVSGNFDTNYGRNLGNLRGLEGLRDTNSQLMSLDDFRKNTSDTTSNYINRLATPQIKAQLAAQGMEGSGALPEAIANATAQHGAQFAMAEPGLLQQNAGVRLGEAQNVRANQQAMADTARANAGMGLQAQQLGNEALGMANNAQMQRAQLLEGENQARAMGNQAALQRGQLFGMENDARLAQNQAALQRGQLFGLENQARDQYNQALSSQAMLPEQVRQMRGQTNLLGAQRANTLFGIADQDRGLEEQDYLRRMGLATTAYTGLPYTPGSSQTGRQSTQPLFNWFGQG